MISYAVRLSCLLTILVICSSSRCAADNLPKIAANDNRARAGKLQNGVLTVRLELGLGRWQPESEDGEALTVYAFGETGQSLQNPGPLIRVPQGTEIHAIVHNALSVAATIHGLHERPGNENDAFTLQPDATREVRFMAGTAGTYYYWATTTGSLMARRLPIETQLAGAFIADPPGMAASDRVLVIGIWYKDIPFRTSDLEVATINGKSWPYTERFTFRVGETVHWRWLNPSVSEHAMHLHGFYFHLDGKGNAEHHHTYAEAERPLVVTQLVEPGETFDMTWVPERAGRWLFHCHMLIHMSPPAWQAASAKLEQGSATLPAPQPASSSRREASAAATYEHRHGEGVEQAGMGGLVLGITVADGNEKSEPAEWHAERKLQLEIDERKDGERPLYALQVHDVAKTPSRSPGRATPQLLGPPIVVSRGQPVEIEVINRTAQPTAIHWHGIELESYYDGVAGWTGTTQQTTPAIQPGESFSARMIPPRAGTFIYHTHWHERAQLENGIYGPLIVVPPGQSFDSTTDKIFLFSMGVFKPFGTMLLINGHPQPLVLQLATATKYRFRLINIAPDNARMRVSLRRAGTPVQWRIVAKDGADVPPSAAIMQTAELAITVGETYDFEYEASTPQDLALEVYLPGPKLRATQGLVFAANRPSN